MTVSHRVALVLSLVLVVAGTPSPVETLAGGGSAVTAEAWTLSGTPTCPASVEVDHWGRRWLIPKQSASLHQVRLGVESAVADLLSDLYPDKTGTSRRVARRFEEILKQNGYAEGVPPEVWESVEIRQMFEQALAGEVPGIGSEVVDGMLAELILESATTTSVGPGGVETMRIGLAIELAKEGVPLEVALQIVSDALPSSALPSSNRQPGALPSSALDVLAKLPALPSSDVPGFLDEVRRGLSARGYRVGMDRITGHYVSALPSSDAPMSAVVLTMATALPSSLISSNAIPANATELEIYADLLAAAMAEAIPANALPSSAIPANVLEAAITAMLLRAIPANALPSSAIPANVLGGIVRQAIATAIPANAIPANAIPANQIEDLIRDGLTAAAIPANAIPANLLGLVKGSLFGAIPANAIPANAIPANLLEQHLRQGLVDFGVGSDAIPANFTAGLLGMDQMVQFIEPSFLGAAAIPANGVPLVLTAIPANGIPSNLLDGAGSLERQIGTADVVGLASDGVFALGATDWIVCHAVDDGFGMFDMIGDYVDSGLILTSADSFLSQGLRHAPVSANLPDPWAAIDGDYSVFRPWWDLGWTVYGRDCGYTLLHDTFGAYAVSLGIAVDENGAPRVGEFVDTFRSQPRRISVLGCAGYDVHADDDGYDYAPSDPDDPNGHVGGSVTFGCEDDPVWGCSSGMHASVYYPPIPPVDDEPPPGDEPPPTDEPPTDEPPGGDSGPPATSPPGTSPPVTAATQYVTVPPLADFDGMLLDEAQSYLGDLGLVGVFGGYHEDALPYYPHQTVYSVAHAGQQVPVGSSISIVLYAWPDDEASCLAAGLAWDGTNCSFHAYEG